MAHVDRTPSVALGAALYAATRSNNPAARQDARRDLGLDPHGQDMPTVGKPTNIETRGSVEAGDALYRMLHATTADERRAAAADLEQLRKQDR